jgi:integrase/recombinase XerC
MTTPPTATTVEVDAARLLLARIGLTADDLLTTRPPLPTFTEYIPVVSAAVSDGTRRVYNPYWNRIQTHWGHRHLDEPTLSQIKQLAEHVKTNVVARRNAAELICPIFSGQLLNSLFHTASCRFRYSS